jgi:urocanate reductase
MKHACGFTLILLALTGCAAFGSGSRTGQQAAAGNVVYEGTGHGYRGPVRVQVRMKRGSITAIEIIDSREDFSVGQAAMEELMDMVILYNTTDLDAVSGATESSKGFLEAVENAIMGHE